MKEKKNATIVSNGQHTTQTNNGSLEMEIGCGILVFVLYGGFNKFSFSIYDQKL